MNRSFLFALVAFCLAVIPAFASAVVPVASWSFNEGSGMTAYDSINGNNCTLIGVPYTTGILGSAVLFNGSNVVDCPNSSLFNFGTGDFFVSLWTNATPESLMIFSKGDFNTADASNNYYADFPSSGELEFGSSDDNFGSFRVVITSGITMNVWHNFIFGRNSSGVLFIAKDGNVLSPNNFDWLDLFNVLNNSGHLAIGNLFFDYPSVIYDGGYWGTVGAIDEFKIFTGTPNQAQIENLYLYNSLEVPVIPASLIHEWKFDEGSGSVAYDSVGTVNCTLFNSPTYVSGIYSDALSFDGVSNSYLDCGNDSSMNLAHEFSIAFWGNFQTCNGIVFDEEDADWATWVNTGMGSSVNVGGCAIGIDISNVDDVSVSMDSYTGDWHYYTFTRNDTSLNVFVDGLLMASTPSIESTDAIYSSAIGSWMDGSNAILNGTLDEVQIWSGALSPTQVENLYLYNSIEASLIPSETHLYFNGTESNFTVCQYGILNYTFGTNVYGLLTNDYINTEADVNNGGEGYVYYVDTAKSLIGSYGVGDCRLTGDCIGLFNLTAETESNDTFGSSNKTLWLNVINDSSCYPAVSHVMTSCGDVTESGLWTIDGDLNLAVNESSCISVQTSDPVVIDCQGHTLNSTVENGTAISASNFGNVTVKNCVFAPFWVENLVVYGFMHDVSLFNGSVAVLTNNSFNSTFTTNYLQVSGVGAYDFNGNYWGLLYHDGFSDLCSADNGTCTTPYDIFHDGSYYDYAPLSNNQLQVAQGGMGVLLTLLGQGVGGFLGGIQDPLFNFLILLAIVTAFATIFFMAIAMGIRAGLQQK